MFSIEGQFYAKVNYVPHKIQDLVLHKKLGIDNLGYEQREVELDKMKDIESLRTSIELYVVATPMMNFGKHYADNSMHLQLYIEDAEWSKLQEKFETDNPEDLEDIGWHLFTYDDLHKVEHITEEEYNKNVRK